MSFRDRGQNHGAAGDSPDGLAFNGPVFTEVTHTITDIVCQHSVKTGEILFLYELDNSGKLVVIAAAEERRAKK